MRSAYIRALMLLAAAWAAESAFAQPKTDAFQKSPVVEPVVPGPQEPRADPSVQDPPPAPQLEVPPLLDWTKFSLGGQYRILPNASNYAFHPETIGDSQETSYLVLQRLRLWLTYNPTDNVEGYLQMQVGNFGGFGWGRNFDFNKTSNAFFNTNDQVGIVLRRAWLAFKHDELGKVRAGILDWHESFRDTMASADYDFNIGGIDWVKVFEEHNKLQLKAAMLLLNDQAFINNNLNPGSHSAYLYAFDVDQPIGDKHSLGFSAYYLNDDGGYSYPTVGPYSSSWDVWVGVRGKLDLDCAPISGFVMFNTGERTNFGPANFNHTGWASQLEFGPLPIGPGKLSVQGLYASGGNGNTTGDSNEFRTLAQSFRDNFGAQGYWSYMHLTSPNAPGDISDLGVGLQNRGFGLGTLQMKYEYPICARLSGTSSGGWLRSATANTLNNSTSIGTEFAQMFTFDFGGNMKLDFGAAVLFTGGFYRNGILGPDPDNLYEGFARLQLEF